MTDGMDIERVFRKPKVLRALTSLDAQEFSRMEAGLEALLAVARQERTHDGQVRQRAFGCGGATSKLPTARAKLFFLLFYFKCYPLQEVMGVLFGLSQPQACEWIKRLTPLVSAVLGHELLLPTRRPADLDQLLASVPELRLLILDGAERPTRRPKDKQRRKDDYSGKKKAHRNKNLLVTSHERRVVYLGPTSPGSVHDKKLADESGLRFPADALVLKDTGFQGYEPPDAPTLQPTKKPRGCELYPWQKAINKAISKVRVGVEHAICGVKRCRIVADTFRNLRAGFVDEAMALASGLHNLRVTTRHAAA